MYGEMQESGFFETIPLICTLAYRASILLVSIWNARESPRVHGRG